MARNEKPSPTRSIATLPVAPNRKLAYVWARMAARYGENWTRAHGVTPDAIHVAEWSECLAPFDRDALDRGFVVDAARCSPFAPSGPQFRMACAGVPDRTQFAGKPYSDPRMRPDLARREVDEEYASLLAKTDAELSRTSLRLLTTEARS